MTRFATDPVRRATLLWTAGLVGLGLVFHDAVAEWFSLLVRYSEESIGLLAPPLVAFLVWRRHEQLLAIAVRPSVAGGVAFVCAVGVAGYCHYLWFGSGVRFALWLGMLALTWAVWGSGWMRALVVPALLLFFLQPLPVTVSTALTHPLRLSVTAHAAETLSLGGLPTIAEGVLLHLPSGTLETTTACSGMRGFVTVLAVALLLAELVPAPWFATAALFPGALLLAYGLNVVRVMMEAVYFTLSGRPSHPHVHTTFGLITFSCVSLLLTLWQLRISRRFV